MRLVYVSVDEADTVAVFPAFNVTVFDSPPGACTVTASVNDLSSSLRSCASSAFTSTPAVDNAFATSVSDRIPVER